jgi:hypothetical protein
MRRREGFIVLFFINAGGWKLICSRLSTEEPDLQKRNPAAKSASQEHFSEIIFRKVRLSL